PAGTGPGDGALVLMKQGSAVDASPIDGTAHAASSVFGSGAQLGTGNYVVFRGAGTQVDVSGLAPSTTYFVAVYAYAGPSAPSINYQQDTPATGSQATTAPSAVPTLSSPTSPFASIGTGGATLGATIDSDNGDAITDYGTVWGTAAAPTGNLLSAGSTVTPPLAFSHARTVAQTPGTLITYRGYATNSAGTAYSPDGSFYLEPNPATGASFSNVTSAGMRVSWTPAGTGPGDGAIVLVKQGSAVDASPVDGTAHTANSVFGSGEQIGSGNYVVFRGAGTQVDVSGLAPSTTYFVAVYAYAGSSAPSINYQQDTPATGSQATLAGGSLPTLSSPTVSAVAATSATLGATIDSNGGSAISAYGTVWGTSPAPTGNALDAGTDDPAMPHTFSHSRTALPQASLVYYRGYADNGAGRAYSPDGSFYTNVTSQASHVAFTSTLDTELIVSWYDGSGDGVLVLMREAAAVDADPVDGVEYAANAAFGSGAQIGTGNYVVYVGPATQVTVTGLLSDITYHVAVYAYAGSGSGAGGINYLQAAPALGNSGHNGAHGINCVDCHFGVGDFHGSFQVPRGAVQETTCQTCHNPTGAASAKKDVAIHTGTKYNANVDCGSCHEVHNNFDFTATDTHSGGVTASNVEWFRPNPTKYVAGALEPALLQANTGFFAWDDANPPWNGACQTCHQNTDWHRNDNSLGAGSHAHNSAADCRTCHGHLDGFRGTGGDCTDCHKTQREISANPGTYRRQITESTLGAGDGEFSTNFTSHHVNDGTGAQIVTKWDCVVCHSEGDVLTGDTDSAYHQKDGVQLRDVDTGTVYSDWSGLTPFERSSFCLSCHDADGATLITGRTDADPDATTNNLNPFNDGITNAHEPNGFDGTPAPHSRGAVVDVQGQFDTLNASHHAVLGPGYVYAADCVAPGDPHPCCTGAGTGPSCALPFGSAVSGAIQGARTDLDWNSVLDCEDCHYGTATTKLSAHGTLNARYLLRDIDGNDTLPADDSTLNCRRCHDPEGTGLYPDHTRGAHMANALNLFGIACLSCHGGGEYGGIHGVDAPVTDDDGGGSYNPNVFTYGSGLDLISNWTDFTDGGVSCSAMGNPTLINDCTQHSGQSYGRLPARNDTPQRIYNAP
ncbi:MAG: hypothetical protein OEM49_04360, partial [Myxococcales bacterium]|nr:hypothetical protein [Myxococcales bacterium]